MMMLFLLHRSFFSSFVSCREQSMMMMMLFSAFVVYFVGVYRLIFVPLSTILRQTQTYVNDECSMQESAEKQVVRLFCF